MKNLLLALALLAGLGASARADISSIVTQPRGPNGSIQYNKRGVFDGTSDISYSTTTRRVSISSATVGELCFGDGTCFDSTQDVVSGGASNLGVSVNGVSVSSPTTAVKFSSYFTGSLTGVGDANISIATNSFVLNNPASPQSGTVDISSGTFRNRVCIGGPCAGGYALEVDGNMTLGVGDSITLRGGSTNVPLQVLAGTGGSEDYVSLGQASFKRRTMAVEGFSGYGSGRLGMGDVTNPVRTVYWQAPEDLTNEYTMVLPPAEATSTDQCLGVGSVTGSTVTMQWSTCAGGGGGGGGSGDASLSATGQVWTGNEVFNNSSTSNAIRVNASGNAGISYIDGSLGGQMVINKQSGSVGDGMVVVSSQGTMGSIEALMHLVSLSASYNEIMLWIQSNSASSLGANADIRIDAYNPDIEFRELDVFDGTDGDGEWEIALNNDQFQINFRNSTNTSYQNMVSFDRTIGMKFKELDNGNDYIAFRAPTTLSGSWRYVLPTDDPAEGASLHTHGFSASEYQMYWAKDVSNQDTLQTGTTFYVAKGSIQAPLAANVNAFTVTQKGASAQGIRLVNEGAGNSLYVEKDTDGGNTSGSSGSIFANCTFDAGICVQVYSNHSAPTATNGLAFFKLANSAATTPVARFENAGTGNSVKIVPIGATGFTDGSSGALFVDNSLNTGVGAQFFSSLGATAAAPIVYISASSNTFAQPGLRISQTNSAAAATILEGDSPAPSIFLKETDQTTPAGKFLIQVQGDQLRMQGRKIDDSGYNDMLIMSRTNAATAGVQIFGSTTTTYNMTVSTQGATSFEFAISTTGHVLSNGAIPAVSTCGTSPAITGTDSFGNVTIGSGGITACTITFASPFVASPACTLTGDSSTIWPYVSAISTTAITVGFSASLASGHVYYHCVSRF